MTECKDCIHFEVCAYASHQIPICDSYAEKERHGRWIRRKSCHTQTGFIDRCSVCQKDLVHLGYKTNFCPNCGAKMDGGDENGR